MRKLLVVIMVLLTVGFLSEWVFAASKRNRGVRQGARISAPRSRNRSHRTYVTRPFAGVNRRYYYQSRRHDQRYYRRRRYDHDRAFRVLPHRYYYGYSYPGYVVPRQYYYRYPQNGISFYWSW